MAMSFHLPSFNPPWLVRLALGLSQEELLRHPAFKIWSNTLPRCLALQSRPGHESKKTSFKLRLTTNLGS